MASANELRNGNYLILSGRLYNVVSYQHVKMQQRSPVVTLKLKDLSTGAVIERKMRSDENVEMAYIVAKQVEYLYNSQDHYYFMDMETFEQFTIDKEVLGEAVKFLKENTEIKAIMHDNKAVSIELPVTVDLKVVKTDPGLRGNTVSGGSKPATLETGAVIQVPLFINEGDVLKVDTRDGGSYIQRA
ncbi:elongation factor P [bacterium]|jgi:elongation factor P|nr:elongation factor P [bacterium]